MTSFDGYISYSQTEHNSKWSYVPDHPYIIPVVGGSFSGKTNALSNSINNQSHIDRSYFYA